MPREINPFNTKTQSSHSMTIWANDTIMVGAINSFRSGVTMGATPVREFGNVTGPYGIEPGTPYETVPGNVEGLTLSISRYDLFTSQMERAWGTADLQMLSNDPGRAETGTGHLTIVEKWVKPDGTKYRIIYDGCWFTRIGRTLQTTGDRIVNVEAEVAYTRKYRVDD